MLSYRLITLAGFISPDQIVADIGCDHGKLSCYLAPRCKRIYAVDCSVDSLEKCKKRAEKHQLVNLYPILGDGLAGLPEAVNIIVIAGLGGDTIADILLRDQEKICHATLILCPASRPGHLAERLLAAGFSMIAEQLITDKKHSYHIYTMKE